MAQQKLHHTRSAGGFTVSGRSIFLNGQRFFIKGVDYGNTNAGYTYYNNEGKLVPSAPVANNAYKKYGNGI